MSFFKKKRKFAIIIICLASLMILSSCRSNCSDAEKKICPDVVIMPMFEIGEMAGDSFGEAQCYYEEYFSDPDIYTITGDPFGCKLYVQNGISLCLLGQGKTNSAINVTSLLSDERFDFSDSLFLVSGCAGSSKDFGVLGDVYIITSVIDFDIGYSADGRDLSDESGITWFRNNEYDLIGYRKLNPELTEFAFNLTKDIELQTTDAARLSMARNFENAEWAVRNPKVLKGSSITSDSYWKGEKCHQRSVYITEQYHAPDPYAATVMEDSAIALAFEKMGMLNQLLILRNSVNMDVFIDGHTPESLWIESEETEENDFVDFTDVFSVSMENCFKVGKTIIEAIRNNEIKV